MFFGFLLLTACQNKADLQMKGMSTALLSLVMQLQPSNSPLKEYEVFLARLDSAEVTNVSEAAEEYAALFKGQPQPLADSGYVLFEQFYQRVDKTLNHLHRRASTDFRPLAVNYEESRLGSLPQELMDYNQIMRENGFEVALIDLLDGGTYLKQNRNFIATHFYSFISPDLKEYLEQINKETKEGFSDVGGLAIIEEVFVDRVIWWENFVAKHPNFIWAKESEARKKFYFTVLLQGLVNNPVLSLERNKLDTYFAVAYQELHKCAPYSEANKLVQPYLKALKRSDRTRANALLKQYKKDGIILNASEPES